jgi:hypothetical protein
MGGNDNYIPRTVLYLKVWIGCNLNSRIIYPSFNNRWGQSRMDNPETPAKHWTYRTKTNKTRKHNTTQKTKKMSNTDPTYIRWWTQKLAKREQFLLLARHPSSVGDNDCYCNNLSQTFVSTTKMHNSNNKNINEHLYSHTMARTSYIRWNYNYVRFLIDQRAE